MRKLVSFLLILIFTATSLFSCTEKADAYQLLSEFVKVYGADGVIYSPEISEGEPGYISNGMIEKIYVFSGDFPTNYAIFLNSRLDDFSECGVFICNSSDSLAMTQEMCLERIKLLSNGGEHAFVKVHRMTVFYSTMQDRNRAERIWHEIIS